MANELIEGVPAAPSMKQVGFNYAKARESNKKLKTEIALGKAGAVGVYERHVTTDATVASCVQAIVLPISQANWSIQNPSENEEIGAFVEYVIHEALNPSFANFASDVIRSMVVFGFQITEPVFKIAESGRYVGKIVPSVLATRPAWSISDWVFDDQNNLLEVKQAIPDSKDKLQTPTLKAETLLIFTRDGTSQNPMGRSMLRTIYKVVETKAFLIKLIGIRNEREALGVPWVTLPEDDLNEDELNDLEEALSGYRAGEIGYMVLPHGCEGEIVGGTPGASDAIREDIAALDMQIREAFIQNMRSLGTTSTGSRAVGEVQADPFYLCVQAIAAEFVEPINQLIKQLVSWNFGPQDLYPYVEPPSIRNEDVQAAIAPILSALEKGALSKTTDVEDRVREELGLPSIPKEEIDPTKPVEPNTDPNANQDPNAKQDPNVPNPDEISKLALNGAQVASLLQVIVAVATKQLPRETGVAAIAAAFNWETSVADNIIGAVGKSFFAETPEPSNDDIKPPVAPSLRDGKPSVSLAWTQPRVLSSVEMRCSFAEISARFDSAPSDLQAILGGVIRANRRDFARWLKPYVNRILDNDSTAYDDLAKIDLPRAIRDEIVSTVQGFAGEIADYGRLHAEREYWKTPTVAERAPREDLGSDIAQFVDPISGMLGAFGRIFGDRIADELLRLMRLGVIQATEQKTSIAEVLDSVNEIVDASADSLAVIKDAGIGVATKAFNVGREEFFEEHSDEILTVTYSAVMDDGTCAECAAYDSQTAPSMEAAEATLPTTPNVNCLGSAIRCRCIWVTDYK